MNAKRKSTLGTRGDVEAPTRLTTILNLLPEFEADDGPRNRNVTHLNSKRKQPRSNKVSTQTTSNRGSAKERPVNRVLYKRAALKPANSAGVHKERPPCPESLSGLIAKSKLVKSSEESSALAGGLRLMRERTARVRAARILSTPNRTNIAGKGEILGNGSPKMQLYMPLVHLTPQGLLFAKQKSDFPCSADGNNFSKRQCKSTAFELLSHVPLSSQSKQEIFVDENRMDHMSTNVTESHFRNENQENLAQEYQKPDTMSYNLTADGLQKENTTNFFPSILIASPFQNLKSSFLQTSISQNFTSVYNSKVGITKPYNPRLNHTPALPSGHLETPISSQKISTAETSSVKLQASEPKPSNIGYSCCNTENILNVPSETKSPSQRNSYEERNICSSKDDKDDKVTNEAEAAVTVQEAACSLKKPQIMEILENMHNLQEQSKTELQYFTERMNAIQNQQFEMLQKLLAVYQAAEERDEFKQSASVKEESKASFSTDMNTMNTEIQSADPEKMLGPIISIIEKKKRRSSRIAAKLNTSTQCSSSTPDDCDKCTAVVSKYKDLQKSFTFLRTPRNCKTPLQGKTPTRTPRTIVSTSIRDQLQLLYDTDSPQ